jgi:hypothetical protein
MENRRDFIKTSAVLGVFGLLHQWATAIPLTDKHGSILPQRRLTRDGEMVTAFCLGGWHLGNTGSPAISEKMVEICMDRGVRFFDNARGYHNGGSEELMGRFLIPKYRDQIFLMTKSHAKSGQEAKEHLELSLKALKPITSTCGRSTHWKHRMMWTGESKTGCWMYSWRRNKKDRPGTLVSLVTGIR